MKFKIIIMLLSLSFLECKNNNDMPQVDECIEQNNLECWLSEYNDLQINSAKLCHINYVDDSGNNKRGWVLSGFISLEKQLYDYYNIKFQMSYLDENNEIIGTEEISYTDIVKRSTISKQFWIELNNSPTAYAKNFVVCLKSFEH